MEFVLKHFPAEIISSEVPDQKKVFKKQWCKCKDNESKTIDYPVTMTSYSKLLQYAVIAVCFRDIFQVLPAKLIVKDWVAKISLRPIKNDSFPQYFQKSILPYLR